MTLRMANLALVISWIWFLSKENQLIEDCVCVKVALDSSSGEQLEGKVLSLCTARGF